MSKSNAIKEVLLYFSLTLGLSYLVFWGPLAVFQVPTISFVSHIRGPGWAILWLMLGGFVPSLTAFFLIWRREGLAGVNQFGRRALQFKIGGRWYLTVILIAVLAAVGQILILRLMGHTFDLGLFLAQAGSFIPLLLIGPLSEEFGWRGYALDRLQTRWSPLMSSLIVGVTWGLWHGPLFAMVGTSQHELKIPFAGFVCGVTALSVIFTWLHNNTDGSIWTAIFFHWIYTYMAQVVASGATRSPLYNWLEYLPYILVALLITLTWKQRPVSQMQTA
jgi:membrane protease YdiL (CAAX protease family)